MSTEIINQENDLGFIKIPLDTFLNIYNNFDDELLNENLQKKATELVSVYNCFVYNYDAKSLWEKKKMIAQKKHSKFSTNTNVRNKPRVVLINLSDEMKCKKEFISFLNKLTDVNKDIIYNKIKEFIKNLDNTIINTLFEVLINFIKISSNNIYIDVLYLFNKDYIDANINQYITNFITNRHWLPAEIIMDYKTLYHNDNYDKYCAYIKLKKNSLSIIKALCIILKKLNNLDSLQLLLNEIIIDNDKYINDNNYKHIIELLLDEIIIILEFIPNKEIIEKIKNYDLNNFEYSTKFKLMKIKENNI
jgi:hypothetical protein